MHSRPPGSWQRRYWQKGLLVLTTCLSAKNGKETKSSPTRSGRGTTSKRRRILTGMAAGQDSTLAHAYAIRNVAVER